MTIFEKIVAGEIPCHKVWENDEFLAFLDIHPVAPGHTLLIPKKRYDPIFAMDEDMFTRAFSSVKKVSEILKSKLKCTRVCLAVVGYEVPHGHIHLIPTNSLADFPWPGGKRASNDELTDIAMKLAN